MTVEQAIEQIEGIIDEVFSDTSVSQGETKKRMEELLSEVGSNIQLKIETLGT